MSVALVSVAALAVLALWWSLRASLAQLDGRRGLPGLQARVVVERDRLGVPTIYATNRIDATRALGFLHAQERFFQMDLSRRAGGGELSELFGAMALGRDQAQRVHRPRARAKQALAQAKPAEVRLLEAYAEGVNAGLEALEARPPEYLLLRAAPARWQPEDTYLVSYSMFAALHEIAGTGDYREDVLRRAFSPAARAFFNSPDTAWGAALDGSSVPAAPIPDAAEFSVGGAGKRAASATRVPGAVADANQLPDDPGDSPRSGKVDSNNWAVDGHRSGTGAAIVANDMHLELRVPNTWYRARLIYQDPELGPQDVTGVTLPGAPVVVAGSNRHVAWADTASNLDITDLVKLELDPSQPRRYRTSSGWREFQTFTEIIRVRGSTNSAFTVDETLWGPVVTRGAVKYALACTMHEPDAVNLGLLEIERARDTQTALRLASLTGTPVLNFIVGDRAGNIGYTLLGRLPNRAGFSGVTPESWADESRGWRGWVPPERYPRVINPTNGVLWTANNRTLGSLEYNALHIWSPDNGARARQIRDDLLAMEKPSEQALWSIYRDDRALYLDRWQKLLLAALDRGSVANSAWREAQALVSAWGGRAAVESQGYRLVRGFRSYALELLFEPVNQHLGKYDKAMRLSNEDAAWAMLTAKPVHLLNPKFTRYENLLDRAVKRLLEDLVSRNIPLSQATWGSRNLLHIQHPLSLAVPRLSRWLDMPAVPVSGDSQMPKVLAPGFGVSQRMVVSPGHEEHGLYNMPCGQSGHFLSPFYRSEMEAWVKVEPLPFLPGPKQHRLELVP